MPLLHIQQIYSEWTSDKEKADLRSQFKPPTVYPVPYFEPSKTGEFQVVRFLERDSFQIAQVMRTIELKPMLSIGALLLHEREPLYFIDFIWSQDLVGFPRRESKRGFKITAGQWAQVSYNGWFENQDQPGERVYRSQTFNILYDAPLLKDSFTKSKPSEVWDLNVEI